MHILSTIRIRHLPRVLLLYTLRQQLEFRNWKFKKSFDDELYFILGNREIDTDKLCKEHLVDTILEIVLFW